MKYIYVIAVVLICATSTLNAQFYQSGNITDNNNQTTEGRILIDNSGKKVSIKIDGNIQTYLFNDILTVKSNNRLYSKIEFENENVLGYQIVLGKASLYHLNQEDYLIKKETGEGRIFNLENDKAQVPGILSILFSDCNEIRDAIHNSEAINERILTEIVSEYNNCSYSEYTPTENEINNANTNNTDVIRFYGGFQSGINSTTINGFESNNTTGYGIGFGLATSPSFTGKIQGNLYFDFDVSMIFTEDEDYNNHTDQPLNYKVNSYKLSLGLEYVFNKTGKVQPFLGIGYGYTSDHYDGVIGTISFKDKEQNFFFIPKIGMLYQLNNGKHLGLTVSYISEYDNDLSFRYGEGLTYYPLMIETSAVNVGLNYYF